LNAGEWREMAREERGEDENNPHALSFVLLERNAGG
jgi:hypothetical protein